MKEGRVGQIIVGASQSPPPAPGMLEINVATPDEVDRPWKKPSNLFRLRRRTTEWAS